MGLRYGCLDRPEACPEKKPGHLEHPAVIASLFRDHAVQAKAVNSEEFEQTRERIMSVIKDSGVLLNVQMFHPERTSLLGTTC